MAGRGVADTRTRTPVSAPSLVAGRMSRDSMASGSPDAVNGWETNDRRGGGRRRAVGPRRCFGHALRPGHEFPGRVVAVLLGEEHPPALRSSPRVRNGRGSLAPRMPRVVGSPSETWMPVISLSPSLPNRRVGASRRSRWSPRRRVPRPGSGPAARRRAVVGLRRRTTQPSRAPSLCVAVQACRRGPPRTATVVLGQQGDVVERRVLGVTLEEQAQAARVRRTGASASSSWTVPKPPQSAPACVPRSVSPVSVKANARKCVPGRNTPFSGRLNGVPPAPWRACSR